jgi:hypothetical protein
MPFNFGKINNFVIISSMKNYFFKIKSFILNHKITTAIMVLAILATLGILYYDRINNPIFKENGLNLKKKEPKVETLATLTGLPIPAENKNRRPFAVVIENHPDARPQSGYPKADIVYEALAEGGITRTLAIFQSQDSDEIGPVRSARLAFIDWLSEFQAIFVHVGGNIDALDEISAKKIPDINQFNFGNYFWRSTDRFAPHNVYTTTNKLYDAAKKAGLATTINDLKWYGFKKDADKKDRPVSQNITINFSSSSFIASYAYDPQTNEYVRSIGGVVAKDKATGAQVRPKNIIVQFETDTPTRSRDNKQIEKIGTIGKGSGFLFQDGKTTKITWEKTSRGGLTKLTDESGNEVKLNPGQTWIEVPPVGAAVSY